MGNLKVDVDYEKFEGTDQVFIRQYADRDEAEKAMFKLDFDCYKVVAEYAEYIEVIFGHITKVYDEQEG